jgi:RNA polymerase-binding transcription factor DksA
MDEHYESELAQSTRVLDDVDRALERLSAGTYGSCEACDAPILGADLVADPTRRVCEQHLALSSGGSDDGSAGAY